MSRFRTVVVPLDFSPHASEALELAIDLVRGSDATIHLVHAYEVPFGTLPPYGIAVPDEFFTQVRDAAARRLAKASRSVEEAGLRCETHVVPGPAADAIVEVARQAGADLVVMSTRGLTGLKHLLLGSVAERTLRNAPCPVLTVRPRERA